MRVYYTRNAGCERMPELCFYPDNETDVRNLERLMEDLPLRTFGFGRDASTGDLVHFQLYLPGVKNDKTC